MRSVSAVNPACELVAKEGMMMKKIGVNFTVFLLFFGVALLEALQTRNWLKAAFWVAIGGVFLVGDILRNREPS
jgi:hypothetical protein